MGFTKGLNSAIEAAVTVLRSVVAEVVEFAAAAAVARFATTAIWKVDSTKLPEMLGWRSNSTARNVSTVLGYTAKVYEPLTASYTPASIRFVNKLKRGSMKELVVPVALDL